MNEIQAMPSFKLGAGDYEVIGTSKACRVTREKVYRHMGGGIEWVLYVDGKRHRAFDTKRQALQHCQLDVTL